MHDLTPNAPGEVGNWFGLGAADGLSPGGFPSGACGPSRLGLNLPSPPFPNRACGSPAHGSPPGSRSAAFRHADGVGG
jgi:hypothetical protein